MPRASEGRERAKACGVKLGRNPKLRRNPKLTGRQKREAIRRPRLWRGDACGDWPQLQCIRADDFEVCYRLGINRQSSQAAAGRGGGSSPNQLAGWAKGTL